MPVAAALSRDDAVATRLLAATSALAESAANLMRRLDSGPFESKVLRLPAILERWIGGRIGHSMKVPRLIWHASELRDCSALVTAERTSAFLKNLPGECPPMIHLRHGAGDRAVGFERRITRFDQLIVAGEKDRARTIAAGLQPAERVHACGYVKLSALRALRPDHAPLFANSRPTVLYCPHFRRELSSWVPHGLETARLIRDSGEFNLIVAPHVRLMDEATPAEREAFRALGVSGEVLVDAGSTRSLDMTYTRTADIYLGDVSSQIYEFAAEPRPCVFLNSHGTDWRGNPDYRMWQMGEVVESPQAALEALRRAPAALPGFLDIQRKLVLEALGDTGPECAQRAARIIRDFVLGPR